MAHPSRLGRWLVIQFCLRYLFDPGLVEAAIPDTCLEAVATATSHLQEENNLLIDKLDRMEALHDTLEAASDQFRIKTKDMKQQLDSERVRYVMLQSSAAASETSLNEEIASLREQLGTTEAKLNEEIGNLRVQLAVSEAQNVALTNTLQAANDELSQSELLHQKESERQSVESRNWQQRYSREKEKTSGLERSVKTSQEQLIKAKAELFTVRQQLFDANERLRMSEDGFQYLQIDFIRRIMESDEVKLFLEPLQQTWSRSREHMSTASTILQEYLWKLWNIVQSVTEDETFAQLWSEGDKILRSVAEAAGPTISSPPVRDVIHSYQQVHDMSVNAIELVADSVCNWSLLQGSRDSTWLCEVCRYAKAHSGSIVAWIEIFVGLLCLDFAFSTLRWLCRVCRPRRRPTKKKASPPKTVSLLRRASKHQIPS